MEKLIEKSIDRVLEFYESEGVSIGERPTFTYVDGYHPMSKQFIAQAPQGLLGIRSTSAALQKWISMRQLPRFYQRLGLSFSQAALEEYIAKTQQRIFSISAMSDEAIRQLQAYGSEMLFFRTLKDLFDSNYLEKAELILDDINAHELWHVVEARKGLMDSMIVEGTAEYVRARWKRWKKDKTGVKVEYKSPDVSDEEAGINVLTQIMGENTYRQGREIVAAHAHSLQDLLNPEVRSSADAALNEYLERWVAERIDKQDMPREQRAAVTRIIWPELNILDQRLTKENLITAFRNAGLKYMACELEGQDCALMLEEFARIGYGQKKQNHTNFSKF